MDKLPVGQLPDLQQSNNDDEIMVITNSEYSQLKKEKISDLITDFTSTNENNALTKGTDGKMFVTDFGNASNITEGTLPVSVLPNIPKDKLPEIETNDLPDSGITAGTYTYPTDIVVNSKGQVTSITEGQAGANNANQDLSNLSEAGENHFANPDLSNLTAEGEKHFLNKTQITNCILSAPNGVATYSGSTITVKQGLKVLIPNGRNADGTLKNIEYTVDSDMSLSLAWNNTYCIFIEQDSSTLLCPIKAFVYVSEIIPTEPPEQSTFIYKPSENVWYSASIGGDFAIKKLVVLGTFIGVDSTITSFTPYQPVELIKRTDKEQITSWSFPSSKYIDLTLGADRSTYTAPANGWFAVQKVCGVNAGYIYFLNRANKMGIEYPTTNASFTAKIYIPVKKGDIVEIGYYMTGKTDIFRFIYAEGEN